MRPFLARALALGAILVLSTGCKLTGPSRTPKVPSPPASARRPAPQPPPAKPASPEILPDPPEIQAAETHSPPTPLFFEASVLPPPPPEPPVGEQQPLPDSPPGPEVEPPPAQPPAVPQLTELLPDEKKWEYGQEIDRRLQHLNQLLRELEKRSLNREQVALLDRVRVFVRQTTQSRGTDLVTARNLSLQAELLAEELERTTR